jgi:hypothetical protein
MSGSVKPTSGSHWIVTAKQPDQANAEEMRVGQKTDGPSIIGIFSGRRAAATPRPQEYREALPYASLGSRCHLAFFECTILFAAAYGQSTLMAFCNASLSKATACDASFSDSK